MWSRHTRSFTVDPKHRKPRSNPDFEAEMRHDVEMRFIERTGKTLATVAWERAERKRERRRLNRLGFRSKWVLTGEEY